MEPIIPLDHKSKQRRPNGKQNAPASNLFDPLTCILAIIIAGVTFGAAGYFLFGFAQTDLGVLTLLSSAALCFGIGGLAYLPSAFIAWAARQAITKRATRLHYGLSLFVSLPWVVLSIIFLTQSAIPKLYGFSALAVSMWLSLWATVRLIKFRDGKPKQNDTA